MPLGLSPPSGTVGNVAKPGSFIHQKGEEKKHVEVRVSCCDQLGTDPKKAGDMV